MEGNISGDGRFSTTINGTLTGRDGDWIIIDDPLKASGEMSVEEFINFLKQNFFLCKAHSKTGVIARQTEPRPRDGSATTRFVVNGSRPRSTTSTEAKKLFKSMQR